MSFEILKPFYVYDRDVLKPKINLRRVTTSKKSAFAKNDRFYFAYNRRNILFYLSVTSFCKEVIPPNQFLLEWYVEQGKEGIEETLLLSSTYGSIMHDVLLTYLRDKELTSHEMYHMLDVGMKEAGIHRSHYDKWKEDLTSDFLAFAAWIQEYDIRPIVIEYPVASNKMKLGGMLDLVCTASIPVKGYHGEVYLSGANKGEPKETIMRLDKNILVDLKSGRKHFYETHILQLECYRKIWNEMFGKILPVESVFNWAPTDWRKKPDSTFTCQDGKFSQDSMLNYLERIRIDNLATPGMTYKKLLDTEMTTSKMPEYLVLTLEEVIRAGNDLPN